MSEEPIVARSATQVETCPEAKDSGTAKPEEHRSIIIRPSLSGVALEVAPNTAVRNDGGSSLSPQQRVVLPNTWSARDLIELAKKKPPVPIIGGLLNEGDILLLHGTEESFKSVFVVQCAEAIATGKPFLRKWHVRGERRVGIIETEMHAANLGQRLTKMFPRGNAPEHMYFMREELLKNWRRQDLSGKFDIIEKWLAEARIQVLIIDTANDFFRGDDNANEERHVGEFFDRLRNLDVAGRIIVRHDRKRRDIDDSSHSNELIRGSAEWKEDPEAIIHLKRTDKRTHEVQMEVGKLRYGTKPEPCELWFDSGCFRLVPLPPVIAVLESGVTTRREILAECQRFGLKERAADDQLRELNGFLKTGQVGHERTYEIDLAKCTEADWYQFLAGISAAKDMQC